MSGGEQCTVDLAAHGLSFTATRSGKRGYLVRLCKGDLYCQWFQGDAVLDKGCYREYSTKLDNTEQVSGRVL